MPIQYIIDYLKQNKDKFPLEILKKKLIEAGYPESKIDEAIKILQQPIPEALKPARFWDFRHKKIYLSRKEKFLDFIFGFFVGIIMPWLLNLFWRLIPYSLFSYSSIIFNLILYLGLIIYFFIIKRGYVSWGIILSLPFKIIIAFLFFFRFIF